MSDLAPVTISGDAHRDLSQRLRAWSGWPDASLFFTPVEGGHASTLRHKRQFTADLDVLVQNPNRVLLTVTPFRLRQEAVLTGALLHEAGHARHSLWRTPDLVHHDGAEVTEQEIALAVQAEEARIEGAMTKDIASGEVVMADNLSWTMRAAAAHLLPRTRLSADPDQALIDIIVSFVQRAGRQFAVAAALPGAYTMPNWVQDFVTILHGAIEAHLTETMQPRPSAQANQVITELIRMCQGEGVRYDQGSGLVDHARLIFRILFPETEPPMPDESDCGSGDAGEPSPSESGDGGESDEEGEQGEGNTEPEDEGSGEDPGAGDTGDDEADPSEEDGEGSESDEAGDQEPDQAEGEGEEDGEAESPADDTESDLAKALSKMEATVEANEDADADNEKATTPKAGGNKGGSGSNVNHGDGFRDPTAKERSVQNGASKFLRTLIAPSDTSKVVLTESPSSTVDGGALASWKAGGQVRDPRFFKRTRRESAPSAPIKIAVLVDVSSSMDQLQKPSALLSWALSAAALDLRNFAGRGAQVESCLIHWGNRARVIQANGDVLPGIREHACDEGTRAMDEAFGLVESEMPGFFDIGPHPENRLLVQFTDWELFSRGSNEAEYLSRGFEAGVNMLTVAPSGYSIRRSTLPGILDQVTLKRRARRGKSIIMNYNPMFPEQVWDVAADTLA